MIKQLGSMLEMAPVLRGFGAHLLHDTRHDGNWLSEKRISPTLPLGNPERDTHNPQKC